MTKTIDIEGRLEARGILEAALEAGWQPYTLTGTNFPVAGWRYPVYNAAGVAHALPHGGQAWRWKAADSGAKPKYYWLGSKPENARYYLLPDTRKAIQEAQGLLYLASGDPDVLAYRAAGLHNTLCWFDGETSIPATLVADLRWLGVTEVVYAPDRDKTGMQAAAKLADVLKGSGIDLTMLRLHGDMDSKADINVLWQESGFDPALFRGFLKDLPILTQADYGMYLMTPGSQSAPTLDMPLSDQLYREWIAEIIKALGPPVAREGRVDRWRCPTARHGVGGDAHPSFRVAEKAGTPIPWPMCSCNIQDEDHAWEIVADALGVESWRMFKDRYRVTHSAGKLPRTEGVLLPTPVPDDTPRYVVGRDVYAQLRSDLAGETPPPEIQPIPFPFKLLHNRGGFAEVMFPGKLIAVLGISGGGKTSFGETCAENLLRDGYDVLWWGPEWSPYESALRSLQRQGGLTALDMARFNQWRADERAGVPPHLRHGAPIGDEQKAASLAMLDAMAGWPGEVVYLDPMAKLDMPTLFDTVRAVVAERRAAGRKVAAIFFDYLQLARRFASSSNAFWAEDVVSHIKALVVECQLVGWVLTQPRKDDSSRTRNGDMLTEAAAQSLSDQQFNLYLTLTPSFDMNGRMLQWATIKIVKNSMGKTGEIQVRTDLAHLRWVEDEYHSPSQTERLRAALPSAAAQQKEGEVIQNDDQNHAVA